MITKHSMLKKILMRVLIMFSVLAISISQAHALTDPETALDEYVNAPDAAYGFEHFGTLPGPGYALHIFSMASQQWRTPGEVDRTLWTHWLAVIVPDSVVTETSMLIIAGGSNKP